MAAKTQLWNKDKEPPPPNSLRKINDPISNKTAETNDAQSSTTQLEKKLESKLNISAPEFFPANYVRQQYSVPTAATTSSSVQNRLKVHKNQPQNTPVQCQNLNGEANEADMVRLRQIISTLTNDPGQFDNLLEIFLDTLAPYFDDITTILNASELLVDQVIN